MGTRNYKNRLTIHGFGLLLWLMSTRPLPIDYDHLDETRQDIRESEAFTSPAQTPSILQRKLKGRVDQEDMIGQVEFI